jgi:hypothetical protein
MEELKVTFTDKVSIVTKPVPLINKVTDADMNELKNKHNDTVDVLTTVDGRLTTAEGDITAVDGRLTTAEGDITALDTSKQNNLGITDEGTHLLTPKQIREGADPETKLITDAEADTKIDTKVPLPNTDQFNEDGSNRAQIKGLSRVQLGSDITFKLPISEFGKMDSPLSTFTITDLTGFTPFNIAYAWVKSGTVPSIITAGEAMGGDVEVFVTGTFSIATEDVNLIRFTILNATKINAEIQVLDVEEPSDPTLFVWADYNDSNKDLVASPTIINNSIHSENYVFQILVPADATSIDLGSGKYALGTANHPTDFNLRSRHQVNVNSAGIASWNPEGGITVITRVKYGDIPGNTSLAHNRIDTNVGFRFHTGTVFGLNVTLGSATIRSVNSILSLNKFWDVAFTYDRVTLRIFARCIEDSVAFSEVGSWTDLPDVDVAMSTKIWMERNNDTSTTTLLNKQTKGLAIYNRSLSSQEVLEVMDNFL